MEKRVDRYLAVDRKDGEKPVILVDEETIPEAYEKLMFAMWQKGVSIETDYDVKQVEEPVSKEVASLVRVRQPLKEPRIHRKAIPEGLDSLQKYVMEICDGIHDHWVKVKKDDGSPIWDYSYHERLFAYPIYDFQGNLLGTVNQVEDLMKKLERERHITKSAQAITWIPLTDHHAGHSPCLQRVLLRLIPSREENGRILQYKANMDTTWRSRDGRNAWFENVYGFTELQQDFAEQLTKRLGIEVIVGPYIEFCDSVHIYGRDFNPNVVLDNETGKTKYDHFVEFLSMMRRMGWNEKTYRSDDERVVGAMREEEIALLADPDYTRRGGASAKPEIIRDEKMMAVGAKMKGRDLIYRDGKLYEKSGKIYVPELLTNQ